MIKGYLIFFWLIIFKLCHSQSLPSSVAESQTANVIIDKTVEKKFFTKPPMRIGADVGKVKINSYIKDTLRFFPLFDSCTCILRVDTLVVNFKQLNGEKDRNKLHLYVANNRFKAYYTKAAFNYVSDSGLLKFKKGVFKKGHELFGELEVIFFPDDTSIDHSVSHFLKGPFRCTIE